MILHGEFLPYSANKGAKTQTDCRRKYELEDYLAGTAIISGRICRYVYSYDFWVLNAPKRNTGIRWLYRPPAFTGRQSLEDVVRMVMTKGSRTRELGLLVVIFSMHFTERNRFILQLWPIVWVPKVRLFALYEPIISGESVRKIMYGRVCQPLASAREMKNVPVFRPLSIVRTRCTITITAIGRGQSNKTKTFCL